MFYPTAACTLALSLLAPLPPSVQEPARAAAADTLVASDGAPAALGRIPADTPAEDAERWRKMVAALTRAVPPAEKRSFELEVDVRVRDERGSNDFKARFGYLEEGEGFVRMTVLEEDGGVRQIQMRGPDPKRKGRLAYWFRRDRGDGKTDGWIRQSGTEAQSDRDAMDRFASASYDIARVMDPNSMRIVRVRSLTPAADYNPAVGFLKLGGDRGVQLPDVDVYGKRGGRAERVAQLAARLHWIELGTPDFRIFETGLDRSTRRELRKRVKRVVFGLDPSSDRPDHPVLILVSPYGDGSLQGPGSVLMQCTEWFSEDDYEGVREGGTPRPRLPGRFYAYETVENPTSPTGMGFSSTSTADLYLKDGSTLDAKLTPADFVGS
ncbi:MAG: hypothetical protein AAFU73_13980 [Planctomycetota bacterium]